MSNEPLEQGSSPDAPGAADDAIAFDYIKSNHFRVIKANGAVGGLSPRGDFVINLFSERPAIPLHVAHHIQDGRIGPEIREERLSRETVIREVEVCAMMDLPTAKALANWINKTLQDFHSFMDEANSAEESDR